jgi:hypothetical protein
MNVNVPGTGISSARLEFPGEAIEDLAGIL